MRQSTKARDPSDNQNRIGYSAGQDDRQDVLTSQPVFQHKRILRPNGEN